MDDMHFHNLVKHITCLDHKRFLDVASCRALIAGLIRIKEGKTGGKRGARLPAPCAI